LGLPLVRAAVVTRRCERQGVVSTAPRSS
jgi:hypothetical protein